MMKSSFLLFLLLLSANSLFAQKKSNDTLVVKTAIYCDHCKECETCFPQIDTKLSYVKGVVDYAINIEDQTITVIYKPKKTNPELIRSAISACGYDADEVKADPKALEKLDGCCKKK